MRIHSLSFSYSDNDATAHALVWLGKVQFSTSNTFEHNPTNLNTAFRENILSYIQVNTALRALITMNFCTQTFCANLMFQKHSEAQHTQN